MIDKFLSRLYEMLGNATIPTIQLYNDLDDHKVDAYEKFVPLGAIQDIVNRIIADLENEERSRKYQEQLKAPYQKFMFVEDGSVDIDELLEEMSEKNPEIKVIVYRQGSNKPEFLDLGENK